MTTDTLRVAITAALRRRGTIDDLDASPSLTLIGSRTSTASVVIYGPDGAVIDVVARASDDAKALRGVAFAVGLRIDPCPACNGRGRRAYGREVEDGCDGCECSGVVAVDPAEEVERWRESVAYVGASCDREITIDGIALRAAHLNPTRFDVERLTRERDEARAEVDATHDLIAAQAALLTGVANALRGEPAPLASHSHHDLDLRAAQMKRELDAMRAAVREHIAAEAACDDARITLGEMSLIRDTPDAIRAADEAVTAAALRLISARKALRKIVEGDR